MPKIGFYSPGATIISLAAMAVMSMFHKPKRRSSTCRMKVPRPIPLEKPQHPGCTAEVFNVYVVSPDKAKHTISLPVGSPVELKIIDGHVCVVAAGQQCIIIGPYRNQLEAVLNENRQYHAYINSREDYASDFYDFFDVIVYF